MTQLSEIQNYHPRTKTLVYNEKSKIPFNHMEDIFKIRQARGTNMYVIHTAKDALTVK